VHFESQCASVEDHSALLLGGTQLRLSFHRISNYSFRCFRVPVDDWDLRLANSLMPVETQLSRHEGLIISTLALTVNLVLHCQLQILV